MSRFLAAMYRDLAKEFRLEAKAMQIQAASLERQADGLMRGVDFFQGKTIARRDGELNTPVQPQSLGQQSTDRGNDAAADGAVAKSGPVPRSDA